MFVKLLKVKARAEYYAKMRDLGAINPDEIRAAERLNPWPDDIGKVALVPANYVTLKKLANGEETPPPPAPAPPGAEPEEDPNDPPDDDESGPDNSDAGDSEDED